MTGSRQQNSCTIEPSEFELQEKLFVRVRRGICNGGGSSGGGGGVGQVGWSVE